MHYNECEREGKKIDLGDFQVDVRSPRTRAGTYEVSERMTNSCLYWGWWFAKFMHDDHFTILNVCKVLVDTCSMIGIHVSFGLGLGESRARAMWSNMSPSLWPLVNTGMLDCLNGSARRQSGKETITPGQRLDQTIPVVREGVKIRTRFPEPIA